MACLLRPGSGRGWRYQELGLRWMATQEATQSSPWDGRASDVIVVASLQAPASQSDWRRWPVNDGADALPSPRDVTHARKQPPQFHDRGKFAALLERGADDGCLCLANAEHRPSVVSLMAASWPRLRLSPLMPVVDTRHSGIGYLSPIGYEANVANEIRPLPLGLQTLSASVERTPLVAAGCPHDQPDISGISSPYR